MTTSSRAPQPLQWGPKGSIKKLWNYFGFFWVKKTKRRWWMGSQGREIGQGVIRQFAFSLFENIWGGGGVEVEQLCHRTRKAVNLRESRFSRILENSFDVSLLNLEAFSFHFSFLISIPRHFHFTFHSRNEWMENKIHFSILEKSESISDFTLFLEKKEWNCACNFVFCHDKFTFLIKVKVY